MPLDGLEGELADAQHVGPPSALLVRALEPCDTGAGKQLSRITVEVLGPVPAGEVQTRMPSPSARSTRYRRRSRASTAGVGAGRLPGFLGAVEWRWPAAGVVRRAGPRHDLAAAAGSRRRRRDAQPPLQRLLVLADAGNGAAAPLDLRHWLRVNTELTVHLHRPPVGEWMAVAARTVVGPTGMGTVSGLLFDEQGHAGRSTQSVVVRPR